MSINSIYNISFYNRNFSFNFKKDSSNHFYFPKLDKLSNISFLGNNSDPLSFEKFNHLRKEAQINSIFDLSKNFIQENFLGSGANSSVYKFSDDRLSSFAIKVDHTPFEKDDKFISKTIDEFYGMNFGQEIAKIGDRFRILKRINGTPHSISDWSNKINTNSPISKEESYSFLSSINLISKFPQNSFDDYAKQLKTLSDKGYKQDSINPNNILVDFDNQKLHIIDFFKADNEAHTNSRIDLINVLLDFSFFDKFYANLDDESKIELLNSSKEIVEKCNIASRKMGIIQDEETYLKYLTEVDKWFGIHLKHKGGDYRDRYDRLKNILPVVSQ